MNNWNLYIVTVTGAGCNITLLKSTLSCLLSSGFESGCLPYLAAKFCMCVSMHLHMFVVAVVATQNICVVASMPTCSNVTIGNLVVKKIATLCKGNIYTEKHTFKKNIAL